MNYYERYMGDYERDTAHLSLSQCGAYDRLLDFYYSSEKPLPADYQPLYRICRAMDESEQIAVRSVVDEFFPVDGSDGLRHNSRADWEIEKARLRINSAQNNGKRGGRPRKDKTQEKPSGFQSGFDSVNENETQLKPNEKLPIPHAPYPSNYSVDILSNTEITQEDENSPACLLSIEFRKCGILGSHPSHGTVVELAALGIKPESIAAAVGSARATLGNHKQIQLNYVATILREWATAPPRNSDLSVGKFGLSEGNYHAKRPGNYSESAVDRGSRIADEYAEKIKREIAEARNQVGDGEFLEAHEPDSGRELVQAIR